MSISSEKLSEDRKNYYDKWHTFAKDEVKKAVAEEEEEKQEAATALGLNSDAPKSLAEKQDLEKRQALKEAKKQWQNKELSEASQKFAVENLENVERVLDSVKLQWKPVIVLKGNKNCKFVFPSSLKHKLIKIFVENCDNCEIDFEHQLITQHIEVARCNDCVFRMKEMNATLQIDICKNVTVEYAPGMFEGEHTKIYHAGVDNLAIKALKDDDDHVIHEFSYKSALVDEHKNEGYSPKAEGKIPEEVQFVTNLSSCKTNIVTNRVIRDAGNLPSTKEELKEKEISVRTFIRDAELKKLQGNEAFQDRNYAQAAVFYTDAIDLLQRAKASGSQELTNENDISHVLYCNRAFCWQKMGHHEKAEEDSRKSIEDNPDYCKGLFRLGLALHAQKKYFEAVPILGKALKLEPKNEQIKQALGFAEIQMQKMMRRDD